MLTEKSAISNGLFSLLSLTAVRRLNSDAAEEALDGSELFSLLLQGSGCRGWDDE